MPQAAFGYLWLSPRVNSANEQSLSLQRESSLRQACLKQGWSWQGLELDRSLNTQAAERPLLKRRLKNLQEPDILLIQSTLDLGRRFYDVFALMELFRRCSSKGNLVVLDQDLRINRHEGSEVLMILSSIPQLQGLNQPQPEREMTHRSEVSRVNGGACPYGYQIDPDSNEFVLLETEAQIVQRIFKERSRGRSLRQIAQKLSHEGIKTKRGGRWHANTIKSILENPFYTGEYHTHYARLDHHHPAVVSSALFYDINSHFSDDIAL